jgi:hypothetical protein
VIRQRSNTNRRRGATVPVAQATNDEADARISGADIDPQRLCRTPGSSARFLKSLRLLTGKPWRAAIQAIEQA